MSLIPMNDRVTVVTPGEFDDWGRPGEGTRTEYACRLDYQTEVVKADNGNDELAKATILLDGFVPVTTDDTLEWVDDYGEHTARPLSVSPIKDLSSKVLMTKVVV